MFRGLFSYFKDGGSTGHVFFVKNGSVARDGIGLAGFVGPKTSVALVPTVVQIYDFSITAQIDGGLEVRIIGNIKMKFETKKAQTLFDFTVNPKNGLYIIDWKPAVIPVVIERIFAPLRDAAKDLSLEAALGSHLAFEGAIQKVFLPDPALPNAGKPGDWGMSYISCSVAKIEPVDRELVSALGAKPREALLTALEAARHGRRMEAAANARAFSEKEAETARKLEEGRAELIELEAANATREAEYKKDVIQSELAAYQDMKPNQLLGVSLVLLAKSDSVSNVTLSSDLLAALNNRG